MRLRNVLLLLMLLVLSVVTVAFAQQAEPSPTPTADEVPTEEITVTAERVETPAAKSGSSVTVVTRKDIEKQKKKFVQDYLREVPGLNVSPGGPPGQLTSVFIRGAKSEQTLVLIDGVPMNDPSSTGGGFDFSGIPVELVERIEVVRGPQSTIYGSRAMGGVINIITRGQKPTDKPKVNVSGGIEAGGYESTRFNLNVYGSAPSVGYSAAVSTNHFGVLSAAGPRYPFANPDPDPYDSTNVSGKVRFKTSDRSELGVTYSQFNDRAKLDNPFSLLDSPLYRMRENRSVLAGYFNYELIKDKWTTKLNYGVSDTTRDFYNASNLFIPGFHNEHYNGQFRDLLWNNVIKAGDHTIQAGYNNQTESAVLTDYTTDFFSFENYFQNPRQQTTLNAFFVQDNFDISDKVFLSAGLRHDSHSTAGSRTTYRVSANAHLTEEFFVKGSVGTGFKAPTLYQLFSPYGNVTLRPELSTGWDAGLEYRSKDLKHTLGFTYFNNHFTNLIDFDFVTFRYFNVGRARTDGFEIYGKTRVHPRFLLSSNYTSLTTRDEITNLELLRRPRSKFVFGADYDLIPDKSLLHADVVYTGKRIDIDQNTFGRVEMPSYTLFNLALSYKLNKNLETYIRADNLFNNRYEAVWGYNYPGRIISGGVKFNF